MRDDDRHDPHSGRAHIAEVLRERRIDITNDIVARMRRHGDVRVSPLVVRTLVHALATAIADSSPDIVVHWSRMVRHAHAAPLVVAMIETACEVAEELAHAEHADLATIVVFLEIVKSRAVPHAQEDMAQSGEPATHTAIESLLAMLRARDDATCTHSRATGEWARRIATRMELAPQRIERIVRAAILHDIGKIRIPDEILVKPSALTAAEWDVMKQHPDAGAEILSQIPALAPYAPIVRTHHEWVDGRGYPQGLRGEEISLESRVVSVADSFHAMVSDRPYRRALSYGEAITALTDGRGRQWDADVTDVMIALAAEDRSSSADANLSAITGAYRGRVAPRQLSGDVWAI